MKTPDEIRHRLQGPISSIPTVFTQGGEIDHDGMRAVIDRSIESGSDVVMVGWGASLMSLLTDAEVFEINRTVAEYTGDRALTIAGDRKWGLGKTLELAAHARELGCDLYAVRPADWARGTPDSLAELYRTVAREMRLMLAGDVPIPTFEMLADEPNVLAYLEHTGLDLGLEVMMTWGDRLSVVSGGGQQRHHVLGAHGDCNAWVDPFVQWNPKPAQDYRAAWQRGDADEAWRVVMRYEYPLRRRLAAFRAGEDGLQHALLEIYGVAPRWRRLPAVNPTDEEMDEVREVVRDLGLL